MITIIVDDRSYHDYVIVEPEPVRHGDVLKLRHNNRKSYTVIGDWNEYEVIYSEDSK